MTRAVPLLLTPMDGMNCCPTLPLLIRTCGVHVTPKSEDWTKAMSVSFPLGRLPAWNTT